MADNSLAFLFDLDGTLVDSVYQHVLAWRESFQAEGIDLAVWRIHRQIGKRWLAFHYYFRTQRGRRFYPFRPQKCGLMHDGVGRPALAHGVVRSGRLLGRRDAELAVEDPDAVAVLRECRGPLAARPVQGDQPAVRRFVERIESEATLQNGDELQIGKFKLVFFSGTGGEG